MAVLALAPIVLGQLRRLGKKQEAAAGNEPVGTDKNEP
jgi:hypothetical protein